MIELLLLLAGAAGWSHYGGDEGGSRYVVAEQVDRGNVGSLEVAWEFHSGDMADKPEAVRHSALEVTPILVRDKLVYCTPFNRIIALDPGRGTKLWEYDAQISLEQKPANQYICRGVSYWQDAHASGECSARIFMGTNDARLIAVDADTGRACQDFGNAGQVRIDIGMSLLWPGEFQITSSPAVIGDVVIVGSAIGDNARADSPRGTVRAFDARTGAPRWTFDPVATALPQSWQNGSAAHTGQGNVWSTMSVDSARDLVFLPTSSASPDFFGGQRPGDNRYSDSVVALRGSTGAVVWHFQTVHHDIWDYDLAAQPNLVEIQPEGFAAPVAAVLQPTKTGFVFTLDRETGKPLYPVEERPVPTDAVNGEWLSPTQPFPTKPPPLVPQKIAPDDAWGFTFLDRGACRKAIVSHRSNGLFTPPSLEGTILYPFTGGGVNWGSAAWDPQRQWLLVNTNRIMHVVTLIPADKVAAAQKAEPDKEISPQTGTPFGMKRELLLSPIGVPCNPPPWGTLAAVDMKKGAIVWEVPLGGKFPFFDALGLPGVGGPMITSTGLVFISAVSDDYLRAFEIETGHELWKAKLPAGGQATPMSYLWGGAQYIVIAAGGHSTQGTSPGDSIVAFALPASKSEKP
jgi:quinoprotein glucose dehydrogenase